MKRNISSILKALLLIGVGFFLFHYVADFSEKQSAVLTGTLFVLYAMISVLRQQKPPFVPYHVFVRPNLHAIVTDFDLVKDTEEAWAEVRAGIEKLPKEPWNIWNSGFSFSIITPQLTYQHGWNSFATELDLSASLEPVVTLRDGQKVEENPFIRPFSPRLELDAWGIGYRLRITLLDWYWDKVKHKDSFKGLSKFDVSEDKMCGTVEVLLAVIPYEEFGVHFWVMPGDSGKAYQDAVNRRAEARSRYGWTGKSETDMYDRETPADRSNLIEHKYFSVSHSAV